MLTATIISAFLATAQAAVLPRATTYTVTVGALGSWGNPDDTPAASYIDKDGKYYYQSAHALYGANDGRSWSFFSGSTMDDATKIAISTAANPANPLDSNGDTTWRCNNSPTGKKATKAAGSTSYAQANYCDLAGVWVDPDTGDWYGLVHNEFTPQPFGDGLHYDSIDVTVSRDQGKTWTITDQAITSPYSTVRADTTSFPGQTYYYGDGDPRIHVDISSGYFYVWYGSRVVNKGGYGGSWVAFHEHVARAPISGKMAAGTWQKFYNGGWTEAGLGGKESNLVPTSQSAVGYTPPAKEYNPLTQGTAQQQIANGQAPATSPLFVMDVSYNAYLGIWIAEPQAVDQSGNAPQEIYYTTNLETQQWTLLGNTGSYHTASWYRWFLDSTSKTSSAIVGKSFRAYCSFGCSGGKSSEYVNIAIESSNPFQAIDTTKSYTIGAAGAFLTDSASKATSAAAGAKYTFKATGDGAYTIQNASGGFLGVASTTTATRAWGTVPAISTGSAGVGQQWWVIQSKGGATFRLVNRYSGLVLALSGTQGRLAETTPARSWDSNGSGVGGGRKAAEQELVLTAA